MENKHEFSLFYDAEKGIKNTKPIQAIDFKKLVAIYRSDKVYQLTNQLRNATAEDKARIKNKLPFFTPYGAFTKRNNESIVHHNSNIVAFDFDKLNKHTAQQLKQLLTYNNSVLLSCISPSENGVKALVLLDSTTAPETHYNTLKFNSDRICESLGIKEYKEHSDRAQFVLCQPMFIAHDRELYVNYDATPLLKLQPYQAPQIEHQERTILAPSFQSNRIEQYLLNASNKLYNELINTKEGRRHHSIIKVQRIASWIHYAPHLESIIKNQLQTAVLYMYGDHKTATDQNGLKSFAIAWDGAIMDGNKTIETIINDIKTTAK